MNDRKRLVLIVGIVAIVVLGLALGVFVANRRAERSAFARAETVLLDSAREQAETFSSALGARIQVLETISASLSLSGETDAAALKQRLDDLAGTVGLRFASLELLRPDGLRSTGAGEAPIDVSDRAYFQAALSGACAVEHVTCRKSLRACLALAVPYRVDGEIAGVLAGLYYEEELRPLLLSQAYGGEGFSLLIASDGDVIVNAEEESRVVSGSNILKLLAGAAFREGDSIEELRTDLATGQSGTLYYEGEGGARIAVLFPLGGKNLPQNDWYVFNLVDAAELTDEIHADWRSSVESMFIFALAALTALALLVSLERDYRRKMQHEADALHQREEQFRIMAEQSGRSVYRYDIARDTVSRLRSDGGATVTARNAYAFPESGTVAAESAADFSAFYARIAAGESPVSADFLMETTDGRSRWFRHISTTLYDLDGRAKTAVVSYYDCTEQRERELAYAKWQQELESLSCEDAAIYEWNLSRDRCDAQRGALVFPYAPDDPACNTFDARTESFVSARVFDEDRVAFSQLMNREHLLGMYFSNVFRGALDYRCMTEDGSLRWRRISVQLVPYPDTSDIKAYVVNRDIHEQKLTQLALLARSQQDSLTGTLNRETFIRRAEEVFAAAPSATHALLMLDVDGFKQINDRIGHEAGDRVLVEFVHRIRTVLRTNDLVGRIGGDEFVVCLPDMPFDAVIERKAEQLCATLRRRLDATLSVSVSIGIAVYPRDGRTFDELYHRADAALYQAKAFGRNTHVFYREGMSVDDGTRAMGLLVPPEAPMDAVRRTVLAVSADAALTAALADMLEPDFSVLPVDRMTRLNELVGGNDSIHAVLLDMGSALGRNALETAADRMREAGLTLIALADDASDDACVALVRSGVFLTLKKPVSRELLSLQLERLYALRSAEKLRLQSEYQRLQSTEEIRYREVLAATGTTVFVYDVETRSYQASLLPRQYTGARFDGRTLSDVLLEDGVAGKSEVTALMQLMRDVASGRLEKGSMNVRLSALTGRPQWFEVQLRRMENTNALTPKVLIIVNDINEKVRADEVLRFRAERDQLTGLYNRETFFEKAAALILSHAPSYYVITCFDVDNFKMVNDRYGTDRGDAVLRHIASAFRDGFAPVGGICCRITGDHFSVLYPSAFMESETVRKIREHAARPPHFMQPLTFSIGRYVISDLTLSVSAMLDRAIMAETSVKGRFDGHIAMYRESMREKMLRDQEIMSECTGALAAGQFVLYLQPQYNHATGALIGSEALVRWQHPVRGLVPPDAFIPVFERTGFVYELDRNVWEQACALLRKWLDAGRNPLPVSVNVSRYDVLRDDFYDVITGLVQRYGLPVALLRLEITESAFAKSSQPIIEQVMRLSAFGFTIEIDDFGSGYSSLNTLKDVPANILKLDMRFLEGSDNSQRGGNIVESVVRMAKWLGMPVIAEGVETRVQADFLKSIGCFYVQGYLYGAPMPVPDFEQLAAHTDKEQEMIVLETVRSLNNDAFWDPASLETLIFNSYVGGACIFECCCGEIELLRVNDKFSAVVGARPASGADTPFANPFDALDETNRQTLLACVAGAAATGDEATCELSCTGLSGASDATYLRASMRMLASVGERQMFYCTVENVTAQYDAERQARELAARLDALLGKETK